MLIYSSDSPATFSSFISQRYLRMSASSTKASSISRSNVCNLSINSSTIQQHSILLVSYETDETDYCADYGRCRHRYNLFRDKRLRAIVYQTPLMYASVFCSGISPRGTRHSPHGIKHIQYSLSRRVRPCKTLAYLQHSHTTIGVPDPHPLPAGRRSRGLPAALRALVSGLDRNICELCDNPPCEICRAIDARPAFRVE